MTRPLASLEHFFERIFERPAARLFQTSLEPVQVQRRLERTMDAGRESRSGHVPDRFQVFVNPADLEALGDLQVTLEGEFAEGLLVRSRQRGYRLAQRPVVSFVADPTVGRGEVAIEAGYGPPARAEAGRASVAAVDLDAPARDAVAPAEPPAATPEPPVAAEAVAAGPGEPAAVGPDAGSPAPPAEALPPAEAPAEALPPAEAVLEPGPTVVETAGPHAYLDVAVPGQAPRRVPVGPAMIRIGRGPDNDLVVADFRASRQHGTIAVRHDILVYTDLDSTNGSFVNGARIAQIALGPGDVLRVGDTTITIVPAS